MIHVLTTDRRVKSQLSLLLMDMGHSPLFFASWSTLTEAINKNSTASVSILVDLSLPIETTDFKQLKSEHTDIPLIGFESLTSQRLASNESLAKELNQSLVLPPHAERAKIRLKSVLRSTNSGTSTRSKGTNLPRLTRPGFKRTTSHIFGYSRNPPAPTQSVKGSQYLATKSQQSQECLKLIQSLVSPNLLLLKGEEGSEFELIAREINYQLFGESYPLHILAGDKLRLDALEKLERKAKSSQTLQCCLIGKTEDLTETSASELGLYIDYLNELRNPYLCLILCHELDSEAYFQAGMIDHYRKFISKLLVVPAPPIRKRPEDIPYLCRQTIASMRTAHPFLQVHAITNEGIDYLVQNKEKFTYDKIVRTLRNAMSLSQRSELCVEDLINYGESDHVTQHLLESMADEQFFPTAEAVNS